jgi:hypothetical protein
MAERRKPTGVIGPVSLGDGGAAFNRVEFPRVKEDIENLILALALKALEREALDPWGGLPQRNPENHFDFTVPASPRPEYLDLMEVAPLAGTGGYQKAPLEYNHGELADWVWTKITQKAQNYGMPRAEAIHLLLYSTDFAFVLSPGVLEILAYHCLASDRGFKSIVYCAPDNGESAHIYVVHPRSRDEFRGFSLAAKRARRSLVADLSQFAEGKDSITVRLGGRRESVDKQVRPPNPADRADD